MPDRFGGDERIVSEHLGTEIDESPKVGAGPDRLRRIRWGTWARKWRPGFGNRETGNERCGNWDPKIHLPCLTNSELAAWRASDKFRVNG